MCNLKDDNKYLTFKTIDCPKNVLIVIGDRIEKSL